jgi:tripeptide aminopeptidase
MLDFFLELCAIPSPPGSERAVVDRVGAYLGELGLEWDEDDSAERLDGSAGTIYCRLPGANGKGTPIFLCAHTDTVPLDGELQPVVEDGVVRNAGGTILGSDDKAAIVVMLEAARRIVRDGLPHSGVELVFTP